MFRKLRVFATIFVTLLVGACDTDGFPTEPITQVSLSSQAQPAVSEWNEWQINWISVCGPTQFVSGTYRIHIVRRFVLNPDGSSVYRERLNVASGRLFDTEGGEWIFQENGGGYQEASGVTGEAEYVQQFRMIPKGGGVAEWLTLTLNIRWDETGFYVTSSAATTCR